ncbi:hypothetical protein GGF44_006676, partial [Coemansia sp. RSA 1694]
ADSSALREAKRPAEPAPRKPNNGGALAAENWRAAATAPRPPAPPPQPAAAAAAAAAAAKAPAADATPEEVASLARRRSTGAGKDRPDHRSAGKLSAAATAASWRADPSRGAKPAAEASSQAPLGGAGAAGRQRAQTQGAQMQGSQTQGSQAQGSQAPGAAAGQLDGILNVGPAALPSSSMLPQAMLADILGAAKPALAPIQSSGRLGAAAAAAAYGGGAPGASASLFNVEGSPLMGSSNSPYGAPVRPAVFGHADPGLYTWQGSHVGFHDAPPPPPRELAAT